MKINTVKKILSGGCVFYTIIVTLLYLIGYLNQEETATWVPTFKTVCLVLFFSFLQSGANRLLVSERMTLPLRIFCHFIVCGGAYAVLVAIGGYLDNKRTTLVAMLLFVLLYLICMTAWLSVRTILRRRRHEEGPYVSSFKH